MKMKEPYDFENLEYLESIMPKKVAVFRLKLTNPKLRLCKENKEYYQDVCGCLKKMRKYAQNRWWLSSDPKDISYYTLKERMIIHDFHQVQTAITKVVKHPVSHIFLAAYWNQLTVEVSRIFKGNPMTKNELEELYSNALAEC